MLRDDTTPESKRQLTTIQQTAELCAERRAPLETVNLGSGHWRPAPPGVRVSPRTLAQGQNTHPVTPDLPVIGGVTRPCPVTDAREAQPVTVKYVLTIVLPHST
jgi:hypothetical protein